MKVLLLKNDVNHVSLTVGDDIHGFVMSDPNLYGLGLPCASCESLGRFPSDTA
jgi:hypothetical protein